MIRNKEEFHPYISASTILPEITLKGCILGILLTIALAGSTAYLGLKMGQTISGSIPAAVISMAVLRIFRQSSVLENNIVQTIASAGTMLSTGIIFTIPALVVLGYWKEFGYWQITSIAIVGGTLGILFSIPLRRALIIDQQLKFPEGVAAAEVLKAGDATTSKKRTGARFLIIGAFLASIIKFCQSGLQILGEIVQGSFYLGSAAFGVSTSLSLSMIGAGYIVGMQVAINLLLGAVLAWFVAVPLYTSFSSPQDFGLAIDVSAFDWAMAIRSTKLRYIGVGTMIFGGIYSLFSLAGPIRSAMVASFEAIQKSRLGQVFTIPRTEIDLPITFVFLGIIVLSVPIFFFFHSILDVANLPISSNLYWITVSVLTVVSIVVGFISSAIAGYMAGIVGSSASPISGIIIAGILAISVTLLVLLGGEISFGGETAQNLSLAAMVIIIGAIVATAASMSNDNLQDLKSGHLLGSTPWKQQATLIIGVVTAALVVAPILQLLYDAYGIGDTFPRLGMDPAQALAAPQAALMASIAKGVFTHALDWPLIFIGMGIGLGIVIFDLVILAPLKSNYRLSVMAVALGIYLPMEVIMPLIMGGMLSFFARQRLKSFKSQIGKDYPQVEANRERQGLLFASGLIAGDALIGIILAIPFATYQSTSILAVVGPSFKGTATTLSVGVFLVLAYYLYRLGYKKKRL